MKRNPVITLIIIIGIVILSLYIINKPTEESPEEIVKCIGENSELYTQLGCHACETQENIFGENYQYLNVIDCFFERGICTEKQIKATPTWIIGGKFYEGVRSLETLKELTGC